MIDSLQDLGQVECKRFFGGWSLRHKGRQFAMVMEGKLYFAAGSGLRADLAALGCEPFSYEKAGGTVVVSRYFTAPPDCLDDPRMLCSYVRRILAETD